MAAVERDAFLKGYSQGEDAGREAAIARTQTLARTLSGALDDVVTLRKETLRGSEQQVVRLAFALAQRIVQREINVDRSLLVGMARAALDRLADYTTATIRLNPEDCALVAGAVSSSGPDAHVNVIADASVALGGCVVESDFGSMDVSPHAQFEELARGILDGTTPLQANEPPANGNAS